METLEKLRKEITKEIVEKADIFFKENIRQAKDMESLEKELAKGGLVKVSFCSTEKGGKKCADQIKEGLHADVRGENLLDKEKPTGKCVVCGSKAGHTVYIGKAY